MFGALYYSIGCFFIAGILTFLSAMSRPIQSKGESRPWVTFIVWMAIIFSGPYLYAEALTGWVVKDIEKPIKAMYEGVDINGPLRFYRVTWYTGDTAKIVAVGKEPMSWAGGFDRPVVAFNMIKNADGKWECKNYRMVYSDRLLRDGITFPPYW